MNNWLVLPLLVPIITAILCLFFYRAIIIQRWISACGAILNVGVAIVIVIQVYQEGVLTLYMGGWLPPYGIVFVADMFAALLVLTTSIVSASCLFYAFGSLDKEREKHHFYPLFHFIITGVMGSFLTGDIFNLFVCFEVMLISSYALIVLGGTKRQLKETLKYILINILSSSLFVASVAYLYAVTGTLNMAHLSERVAEVGQGGMLTVISILFLIVFGLKAGLFLFFWLPGSYSAPTAVVSALFSGLLTKVGLYAIIRTFTLIFYHDQAFTHSLIGYMAAATMILGGIGAVAYRDVNRILTYNVVAGAGFVAFGIAVANQDALQGVVFYLMHDMIVKTLLFLLGGILIAAAGTGKLKQMGGLIKTYPVLGWMFFITAMALIGVPPLSGFFGKLLIIRGGFEAEFYWTAAIGLLLNLLLLFSLMKIFLNAFWGGIEEEGEEGLNAESGTFKPGKLLASTSGLFLIMVLLGVGAEWIYPLVSQAGEVLLDSQLYIQSVLGR